jgi:parafibromin
LNFSNSNLQKSITMSSEAEQNDPLLNLQQVIAENQEPLLTSSPDPSVASDAQPDLAKATHIHFNTPNGSRTYPLTLPTRFILPSTSTSVDLRSVYFAWLHRDKAVQDYVNAGKEVNDGLAAPGGAGGKLFNLGFSDRMQLKSWLDGSGVAEESEYIRPLEADKAVADALGSAAVASGATGGIPTVTGAGIAAAPVKGSRSEDPRLAEIYRGERTMGDRNTILRGIKPTVGISYV